MGVCTSCLEENKYHENELKTNSFNDLKLFTFEGTITKGKVVEVYDGDTCTICIFHNGFPMKLKFRMHGYDSPEMKPRKDIENRTLHIQAATVARDKLKEKVLNKILWVSFVEEEKFGRTMGSLYEVSNKNKFQGTEKCINKWMIDSKLGKNYLGTKKSEFTVDELHDILSSCNS